MKKELENGPFSCSYYVSDKFRKYKHTEGEINIYEEDKSYYDHNHVVSVVGWGRKEDKEYWIVRNSWGRHFGDEGYFYMKIGANVLGFESNCAWANPHPSLSFH